MIAAMNGAEEKPKLPKAVFERAITFLLAGFGFVAALAWNDAIQSLVNRVFGATPGSIAAKFGYAIIITIVVTIVSLRIGRAEQK